jgi:hypothetical protein
MRAFSEARERFFACAPQGAWWRNTLLAPAIRRRWRLIDPMVGLNKAPFMFIKGG